jgi:hypothetical protein
METIERLKRAIAIMDTVFFTLSSPYSAFGLCILQVYKAYGKIFHNNARAEKQNN